MAHRQDLHLLRSGNNQRYMIMMRENVLLIENPFVDLFLNGFTCSPRVAIVIAKAIVAVVVVVIVVEVVIVIVFT